MIHIALDLVNDRALESISPEHRELLNLPWQPLDEEPFGINSRVHYFNRAPLWQRLRALLIQLHIIQRSRVHDRYGHDHDRYRNGRALS